MAGHWDGWHPGRDGAGGIWTYAHKRRVGAKGGRAWAEPHVSSTLTWALPPSPSHKDLLEAGELKWGTDEAQFIYILGRRSKQHLRLGEHLL